MVIRVDHEGSIPQGGERCMPKPTPPAKCPNKRTANNANVFYKSPTHETNEAGDECDVQQATARSESVKQKSVREGFRTTEAQATIPQHH